MVYKVSTLENINTIKVLPFRKVLFSSAKNPKTHLSKNVGLSVCMYNVCLYKYICIFLSFSKQFDAFLYTNVTKLISKHSPKKIVLLGDALQKQDYHSNFTFFSHYFCEFLRNSKTILIKMVLENRMHCLGSDYNIFMAIQLQRQSLAHQVFL